MMMIRAQLNREMGDLGLDGDLGDGFRCGAVGCPWTCRYVAGGRMYEE